MNTKATGTLNVGNIIKTAAVRYRDREAFFCTATDRRFSFLEVNQRTNRLANALLRQGLKKGDVAGFLCTNRIEIVEIFYALAKIGVLGVPLNYRMAVPEIVELLRFCGAGTFIFDPWFGEIAKDVKKEVPAISHFIGMGDNLPEFALDYDQLLAESSDTEPIVEIVEEDPQYFNLTSGTTGLPKAYLLNQYNNATSYASYAQIFNVTADDVILTVFPMFGRLGFLWVGLGLYTGCRNVIQQFHATETLNIIQSEKVTISNWVSTMAAFMLNQLEVESNDFSSLRALVFAGAPFPTALREKVQSKLCKNLYEFYGLQETGAVAVAVPADKVKKPNSVGQVMFHCEIRIVDGKGKDLKTGETGSIICQAPTATTGYFGNEAKSRESFRDGWFYTGDLGWMDEEGYLYISGREKDMIISGGQNVFSVEVEEVLLGHPAITQCSIIGLPDETWGEMVTAVIVKSPDASLTDEELMAYCKEKMAGFKVPKKFIWTEELLPQTPTGKVKKYQLVEKYSR